MTKEYCKNCGHELVKDIDSKFGYTTYWCSGSCADQWNN